MWPARRWRSARAWFAARLWARLLLAAALFTSPCWCCTGAALTRNTYNYWFTYTDEDRAFFRNRGEYQEGVPSVARRLRAEIEPITDPEEALRQHPDWFVVRCKNGEWVFGYGYDSHGFRVGHGTLVFKDSRGQVRIFFGHVCGTNNRFDAYSPDYWKSLDDFYKEWYLAESRILREWVPPP